jgi:phosphate acyltransferase
MWLLQRNTRDYHREKGKRIMDKVILSLDGMGGDKAPYVPVKTCELIRDTDNLKILLVGEREKIEKHLKKGREYIEKIIHTDSSIPMYEKVTRNLLKNKETSMVKTISLVKEGQANFAISAGNTSAFVAYAISELGLIEGVKRPAIAILLPNIKGGFTILVDAGANVNTKPFHLEQAALMATLYSRIVLGVKEPKTGLLNIGEEETKGDDLRKNAFKLIGSKKGVNFKGNLEGQELFSGECDIVITDGFTGNVVLKVAEGVTRSFRTILRREFRNDIFSKIGAFFIQNKLRSFSQKADYANYGGGILLGVDGNIIISHGRSSPRALYNAIKLGEKIVKSDFLQLLKEKMR